MAVYRNPRFIIPSIARELGGSALSSTEEQSSDPLTRLIDDQQGPQTILDNAADSAIELDRGGATANPVRIPIERAILSRYNLHESFTRIRLHQEDVTPATVPFVLVDGSDADLIAAPDFSDFELLQGVDPERFVDLLLDNSIPASPDYSMGEWYLGEQVTTSSGIVQTWTDNEEPNSNVATTEAGNTYTKERGDPRRVWEMAYSKLSETDGKTLDRVRATVGIQIHPFWFDPPDSGDVETEDVEFISSPSSGSWSFSAGITDVFDTNGNPTGNDSLEVTMSVTTPTTANYTFDVAKDYSRSILRVDVESDIQAWLEVTAANLQLRLSTGGRFTNWSLANAFVASGGLNDSWHRIFVDPSRDAALSSSTIPVDLEDVDQVTFVMDAEVASNQVRFSNFRAIDKRKRPVFCELLNYRKTQSSPNPGFKPQYDIRMTVREVLS